MKISFTFLFLMISIACYSQRNELRFYADSLSGELSSNRYLEVKNKAGEKIFDISGFGPTAGDHIKGLYVQLYGYGQCNGNNKLYFLFKRGQILELQSSSPINCQGLSYFPLNSHAKCMLRNYQVYNIRFLNGRNKNYTDKRKTGRVDSRDREYFIELFYAIDNSLFSNSD